MSQTTDGIQFRVAELADLPALVALLADDELGRTREVVLDEIPAEYQKAFLEISQDANNELLIGVAAGKVVALLQSTYIPNLTLRGTKRVLIEGVRVSSAMRGQGIGQGLFEFALERARRRGCGLAQLTTNKGRPDAIRFYEKLGFAATHEGMKLSL